MSNSTVTTVRYKPTTKRVGLESHKLFAFKGTCLKITSDAIKVTRGSSKASFWIDTTDAALPIDLEEGKNCAFEIQILSYPNDKTGRFTTKFILTDIFTIEDDVDLGDEKCEFMMPAKCLGSLKTDIPGLYMLDVVRIKDDRIEKEKYRIKWFNKDCQHPEFIDKQIFITFRMENSSKIIMTNGEVFVDVEERRVIRDNVEYKHVSNKYYPCLTAIDVKW